MAEDEQEEDLAVTVFEGVDWPDGGLPDDGTSTLSILVSDQLREYLLLGVDTG